MITEHHLDELERLANFNEDSPMRIAAACVEVSNKAALEIVETIRALRSEVKELRDHCNKFCKCPSHGPSIVQIPEGEFSD